LVLRRKNENATYQVYAFEPQHNHPLFVPSCANPLQRRLSDVESSEAGNYGNVRIASEQESRNSTLAENVDDSRKKCQRPLRTRRQRDIKYGEASALLSYLQDQSLSDPSFYHAVQLDAEDKVANIFWADAKMVTDSGQFGDVVSFDIVSGNNTNLRPFASFVGFNNYGEAVLLGMSLMYDATVESFQWLLETFMRAVAGRAPRTFFSRQDEVVAKAISFVMPETHHAICTWHLKQTAKKMLSHLIRDDCNFMREFKACINDYDEEIELFASWEAMINKYNLHGNVWLKKVFEEKEKWARPYMKQTFSAGMKNTQLNARLYSDVVDYLRSHVDIIFLLKHLQKVTNDIRYRELEVEFSSRLELPGLKIRAPILRQASEAYTSMIFQLFQDEYEEFQSAYIVNRDESGPCREYIVAIIEMERQYKVFGNPSEQSVSCSCRKFETLGFLCSHALKILDAMDIKYLPDSYLLKRWTKHGRCLTAPHVEGRKVQADTSSEISSRYQYLCPEFVRLVARASECEESYRMLDQCSVELRKKVEEILQKQTSIDVSATQPDVDDIQISLNTTENESGAVDYSSSTRAKGAKKKGHKSSIGKGLKKKKKKVQPEEPATECNMWDAPTQPGNVLFQVIPAFSFTMVVDLYSASLIVLQRDCNLILILYSTKQIES
jgi:zinc finger SWIM domain-containing protein 3